MSEKVAAKHSCDNSFPVYEKKTKTSPNSIKQLHKKQESLIKTISIIALHILVALGTFFIFPNVFAIGFVVGFIFSGAIQKRLDQISNLWQKVHPYLRPPLAIGVGFICFLAPFTWPVLTFAYSAYAGQKVGQWAKK